MENEQPFGEKNIFNFFSIWFFDDSFQSKIKWNETEWNKKKKYQKWINSNEQWSNHFLFDQKQHSFLIFSFQLYPVTFAEVHDKMKRICWVKRMFLNEFCRISKNRTQKL